MCCQSVIKVGRHQHKTNLSFKCSGILGQGVKNNVKQGALKQYSSLFFVQLQGMTMAPLKFGPLIFGIFVRLPATSTVGCTRLPMIILIQVQNVHCLPINKVPQLLCYFFLFGTVVCLENVGCWLISLLLMF